MKRTIFLLLILSTVLLLFCGCGQKDGNENDTEPNVESPPLTLIENGETVYRIVRSDIGTDAEAAPAILLRRYFGACGVKIGLTTDWEQNGIIDTEVVVGPTERDFDFDIHTVGDRGYVIKAVGQRLYILGGSVEATTAAVERFLTDFMGYSGDSSQGTPLTELVIPADYECRLRQTYDMADITVGGRSLSDFVIIAPESKVVSDEVKKAAVRLQEMCYDKAGIWLDIVSEAPADRPAVRFAVGGGGFTMRFTSDGITVTCDAPNGYYRGLNCLYLDCFYQKTGEWNMEDNFTYRKNVGNTVYYEEFGAVGDGMTDDFAAIRAAHKYANQANLPVRARDGAVYYIGASKSFAEIKTDTDWGTAKFIIDDQELKDITTPVFKILSQKPSFTPVGINRLTKEQEKLETTLPCDCLISVTNSDVLRYIRYGHDANNGAGQTEVFLAAADGTVDPATPILWDYDRITSVVAYPVDTEKLTVRGGIFTTVCFDHPTEYKYYGRGIVVSRSNTVVDGVTHYIENESKTAGSAYSGFIIVTLCADVHIDNCVLTAHRTFVGKTSTMGTYDLNANKAVNVTYYNCTQTNDIMDSAYWGVLGTNYCKNLTYDHCVLSRFDAHQGVANATIVDSTLGYAGINAIGFGTLRIENCRVMGNAVVNLRSDYGSTWDGEVIIRNVEYVPRGSYGFIINCSNPETHDFGYVCYMPHTVTIENLRVLDGSKASGYSLYLFANYNSMHTSSSFKAVYPYIETKKVLITDLTSEKGAPLKICGNSYLFRDTEVMISTPRAQSEAN